MRCVHATIARSARRTGKRQIRGAIFPRALDWPPRSIHLARLFNPSKIKPLYCFSLYLRVAKKYSHRRWEVQRPSNRMRNVPSHWTCAAWSESYSDRPQPSTRTDTRGQESTPWSGNWQFSGDSNQTKSIKICFSTDAKVTKSKLLVGYYNLAMTSWTLMGGTFPMGTQLQGYALGMVTMKYTSFPSVTSGKMEKKFSQN